MNANTHFIFESEVEEVSSKPCRRGVRIRLVAALPFNKVLTSVKQ